MEPENKDLLPGDEFLSTIYGIQFTFATLPEGQAELFQGGIEVGYFSKYKNTVPEIKKFLYNPLKFYIIGDYDLCYITLINNLKFSHSQFEPKSPKNEVFTSHYFQSYIGLSKNPSHKLSEICRVAENKYFIGVINIKLSNGLLIGNGNDFIEYVAEIINNVLNGTPYLLARTFTWFDFSLAVFIDNPGNLADIVTRLRNIERSANELGDIYNNSLLNQVQAKGGLKKKYSLIVDTHSYFGYNHKLIEGKISSDFVKGFLRSANDLKLKVDTEIEWLLKPGHESYLLDLLKSDKLLRKYYKFSNLKIALGKYDFILSQKGHYILASFYLFRFIYKNLHGNLFKHVRQIKTKIFLPLKKTEKSAASYFTWDGILGKFAFKPGTLREIEKNLKALKVSRQMRIKVCKIFINFNNGIQDPIQFPYFLDFVLFVNNLKELINKEYDRANESNLQVKELEDRLNEHIRVFQDAYNIRFLNGYQFENISDFNLDFNNSIPQLLSAYSTLIYEYGKLLYNGGNYGPIIQINNFDTQSNYLSINYSIQHLTAPEFVFSTIMKEILNQLKFDNKKYKSILVEIKKNFQGFLDESNESYLDEMVENGLFDIDYFVIDAIRYMVTYQFNFELFNYWFWSYNYQNSSLFDTGGMFNEDHLRKEMLRIVLIRDFFNVDKEKLQNPSPELYTYWERHIDKIETIAGLILNFLGKTQIGNVINAVFNELFNQLNYVDPIDGFENVRIEALDNMRNEPDFRSTFFNMFLTSGSDKITIRGLIKYLYDDLLEHYNQNKGKLNMLRRNWATGQVLTAYNELYRDIGYAIDQNGGAYFYDGIKMDKYFEHTAMDLETILDFSWRQKKSFFINHLPDEKNR